MAERARATIATIAREAGVSVPTVSKVLNNRGDVAPQTRRRVEDLLVKHRYRRRTATRTTRTGLIDLVFVDLHGQWSAEVLRGVEEATQRADVGVVVSAVKGQEARPHGHWLRRIMARGSDGLLLVLSDLSPDQRSQLADVGMPVVLVDPVGVPDAEIASVGATNWRGGMAATQHLIELGHSRIAVIGGPPAYLCSRARLDGYRSALERAGLTVPAEYVRQGDFLSASGHRETMALLDLDEPPTAIFACADQMAMGVYEALFDRGLRVPQDVSVVGFDDLAQTRWAVPPLTTVRQPLTEMAAVATRMLLQLVAGEELDSTRLELTTDLVRRSSTAPPGAAAPPEPAAGEAAEEPGAPVGA
ncbi:LacI family DNA-binding transcriptional regulator [Allonocardiopsis opalescens]|uniref:LacI family transcriptional regulator n=1 Tax=Allonocardiopsis opalescens TaxID=1144618 RepID=A0A2T0PXG4_9ACTN|nr:LacI family DNA-binding transcriptional regulator [Allonocardiopsis opalescens]PRX96128.1 LacI family transcriptional regulator [Allonocardiopsis opalescens]